MTDDTPAQYSKFGKILLDGDGGLSALCEDLRRHCSQMAELQTQLKIDLAEIDRAYASFNRAVESESDQFVKRTELAGRIADAALASGNHALAAKATDMMVALIQDRPRPIQSTMTFVAMRQRYRDERPTEE